MTYIARVIVDGEVHDEAEFETYEEAEVWCNSVWTDIVEEDDEE